MPLFQNPPSSDTTMRLMSGVPCVGIPHSCNGMSLSGMGLTLEGWCCARRWLSRLVTNTCQTNIKTGYYYSLLNFGNPHPGCHILYTIHYTYMRAPQVVHNRTNQRGEREADKQVSHMRIVYRNYRNYHSIPLVRIFYYLSAFRSQIPSEAVRQE